MPMLPDRRRAGLAVAIVLAASTLPAAAANLTVTANPNPAVIGTLVTFTFSPKVVSTGDTLTFDFGDGKQGTVAYSTYCAIFGGCATISHAYTQIGSFTVLASGKIGDTNVSATLPVSIIAGNDLYVLAAAHVTGNNQTVWRTDLEVYNAGTINASYDIALLPRGADNSSPVSKSFNVAAGTAVKHADVLATVFGFTGSAALRITVKTGTILATSRTYNLSAGGTFGQYVPVLPLTQSLTKNDHVHLLQLSHDPSLKTGFRTNIGLVNPTDTNGNATLKFYNSDGVLLGTVDFPLRPYGYEQLDRAFELAVPDPVPDGFVTVTNTGDGLVFTYASVVDNITGDPTLIPGLTP